MGSITQTPGLETRCLGLFVQSRAYHTSVTLAVNVLLGLPLWTRIVSLLAIWISASWPKLMYTMWVPAVEVNPWVMAAGYVDSIPFTEANRNLRLSRSPLRLTPC